MSEYPDKKELKTIREWNPSDPWGLVKYLMEVWHYDNYIRLEPRWRRDAPNWRRYKRFHVSTAGWSGNEDRIEALKENYFWIFYWQSSKRGGHFIFEIPEPEKKT